MAQHKVVDLVIQRGSVQIVRHVGPGAPARTDRDADDRTNWLVRSPGTWRGLATVGAASASAGLVLGMVGHRLLTIWFANSLLSAGLCLLFLGLLKRMLTVAPVAAPAPAPEVVDPRLLAERVRRVRAILARATSASELYTFERLVQESRWTQAAMLSTLLHMKERGEVVEDLNLDTGEWVYSLAEDAVAVGPGSLMLEERTAQASPPERQG
jgi:hypothetical protein